MSVSEYHQDHKGCFDLFSSRRLSTLSPCDGVHSLFRCIQASANNKCTAVHTEEYLSMHSCVYLSIFAGTGQVELYKSSTSNDFVNLSQVFLWNNNGK